MRAASPVLCLSFACGLLASPPSQALGFGRVASNTLLGQPLDFSATVRLDTNESLARECVFAEVTSGETRIAPGFVRVTLEGNSGDTDRNVRVTTSVPIDEPVVAVSVTLGCVDRITRRFVAFIDPPGTNLAQASTAAPAPALSGAAPRAEAPTTTLAEGPTRATSPRARPLPAESAASRAPGSAAGVSVAAEAAVRRAASSPTAESSERRVAAARRPAAGPRLQLEAPTLLLAAKPVAQAAMASPPSSTSPSSTSPVPTPPAPSVRPSTSAPVPPATPPVAAADEATASDVQTELLAAQRRRIASLEEEVQHLRLEARAQQQALLAVRTSGPLRRSDRYANPRVYSLALLCLLATVLLGGFLGRRARDRTAARWATGPASRIGGSESAVGRPVSPVAGVPGPGEESSGGTSLLPPEAPTHRTAPLAVMHGPSSVTSPTTPERDIGSAAPTPRVDEVAASRPGDAAAMDRPSPRPPPGTVLPVVTEVIAPRADRASSSALEMVDLDQQVDFFIALGQDDAALELLQQHVGGEGGAGPVPLLKMLEIHRRLGDRSAHDRLRLQIDRYFNVHAPAWEADAAQGRSLEAYPATLARLQLVWGSPVQAIATLARTVFRRDAADPAYDLPAYRELLLLHSIARDHVDHEVTEPPSEVDLLLPLDVADEPPIAQLSARPTGAADFAHSELLTAPLDLDMAFESSPAPAPRPPPHFDHAETVPAALRRPADYANESTFVDFEIDLPEPLPPARRA